MTTTYLPLQAAVVLAHALVAHVADELGLRVIFLKGPIATRQGLRDQSYVSGDVDALCEVGQEHRLIDALAARGWYERPESEAHARFVTHSVTLCHAEWPCDIDVHTSFPGFLAPPATVFEALWAHREPTELAEVEVQGPDYRTQCVIILLHGLRAPFLPKNELEIADSRTRFRAMSASDVTDVLRLVEVTGSSEVVRDFFADLGISVKAPRTPSAEYLTWRLMTQPSRTEGWALAISQARGAERWRLLYRAVFPTREHLIIDHPAAAGSARAFARAYLTRWTRAARLAPGAVHNVVLARRARSHIPVVPDVHASPVHADRGLLPDAPKPTGNGVGSEVVAAKVDDRSPVPSHEARPLGVSLPVATYAAQAEGSDDGAAYVLPLASGGTQVPVQVNAVGRELLSLLLEQAGDLDRTVHDAAVLFERPADELRTAICDFRHEMVRLGILAA